MNVIAVAAGALLVVAALRDVFHTLFHPAGRGSIAMLVFRAVWAATARLGARARALSGPVALAGVITIWAGMLIVGWALVYWPWLPAGFVLADGLERDRVDGLLEAVYFSWVTQATLGFGDIVPTNATLRLLAPLQATIGFGLVTAAVTWVLSVYPALQRQRALAAMAHAVLRSRRASAADPRDLPAATAARQLQSLANGISGARADFLQYPSTFYFAAPDDESSLPRVLGELWEVAAAGSPRDELGLAARELEAALESLADVLGSQFLETDPSVPEVGRAWRAHHSRAGRER